MAGRYAKTAKGVCPQDKLFDISGPFNPRQYTSIVTVLTAHRVWEHCLQYTDSFALLHRRRNWVEYSWRKNSLCPCIPLPGCFQVHWKAHGSFYTRVDRGEKPETDSVQQKVACWMGTFFFIILVFSSAPWPSAPTCGTNPSFRKKGSKCLTKKTLLNWVFYSRDSAFSSFVSCKSPLFEFCCHLLWHIGPKPSPANGYVTFKHITSCLAIAKDKESHCKLRRISKNAPGTHVGF